MKKDFRYDAALLSCASFPAVLEADDRPCIVEITVYRLNAVAVTSLMLDGFDPLLNFIGLSPDDTYITQHEVEDIVTVVHIRKINYQMSTLKMSGGGNASSWLKSA